MLCVDLPLQKTTPFIEYPDPLTNNSVTLRIIPLLFLLAGLPATGSVAEVSVPSYILKLVKNPIGQKTATEFDCREQVYLMTTWIKVYGEHRVTAHWFNPEGALQDQGHLDFVGQQKETCGWLALEFLNVEKQTASSHLNAEAAKFYGKWKVQVFLDNNFLEEREFFVRCK